MVNNPYLSQQMDAQAPNTSVNLSGLFPGNSGLQSVVSSLQSAQNAANQANQTRYADILGMYANMGQSGAQQIQQQTQQNQAQNTQNMIGSGLGNTTLTSAMSNQINSMGQSNLLGLQNQLTGEEANVMMQMNQNGPNVGQYASLLQAAANKPQAMNGMGSNSLITPLTGYDANGGGNTSTAQQPQAQAQYFPSANQNAGNIQSGDVSFSGFDDEE
jgi:hypothetical protein